MVDYMSKMCDVVLFRYRFPTIYARTLLVKLQMFDGVVDLQFSFSFTFIYSRSRDGTTHLKNSYSH